jgi:hypothetical protein
MIRDIVPACLGNGHHHGMDVTELPERFDHRLLGEGVKGTGGLIEKQHNELVVKGSSNSRPLGAS